MLARTHLIFGKAYDNTAFRDWLRKRSTTPAIPPHKSRRVQHRYDKAFYRDRNVIDRMFGRLTTFGGSQLASTATSPHTPPPSASLQPWHGGFNESAPQ